jgi:hypothetical protein
VYRDHRIVGWVPYGRELSVSILMPYLLRDHARGLIDSIWLCMNTDEDQASDRRYAKKLATAHKPVTLKVCPGPDTPDLDIPAHWREGLEDPKQKNTGRFPLYMQDRDTIYLRFDDDIVWVHPGMVTTLVDRKLDRMADTIAVFPLILNNAISSYMLQQHGRIPMEWGEVGKRVRSSEEVSAVDPYGWGDPYFAEKLHEMVLERLESNAADDLLLPAELTLGWRQQFSVSCFAIHGSEYADLDGVLSWDEEEHWLTMHHPGLVKKSNIVCGLAQCAHFSFFTQRDFLLGTGLLDRYRALSEKVSASL